MHLIKKKNRAYSFLQLEYKKSIALTICILISLNLFGIQKNKIEYHRLYSPFQKDSTTVRILLPDNIEPGKEY